MNPIEQIAYAVGMTLLWILTSKIVGFQNTVFIALAVIYTTIINHE